ncbi:AAA family ATPase [Alteripontixanthobacter maritimus]|nr:AAA family ATPase [Alteripontixanthobacter maritimus]
MEQKPTIGTVFVPGGMPKFTYVPRTERELEKALQKVTDNLCKLVVVTGATKTGKTVLTRRVLSNQEPLVKVECGRIQSEDDFWQECMIELGARLDVELSESSGKAEGADISGTLSVGAFGAKLKTQAQINEEINSQKIEKSKPAGSLRSRTIRYLRETSSILIADDFHYLPRSLQGHIVRALKSEIFDGFPFVIIAIPHRRYDAVRVEREMNGRIEPIKVPDWSIEELVKIPKIGFPLLGMKITDKLSKRLAEEAYGSPHLMQEFCKELAQKSDELTEPSVERSFDDSIFIKISEHTGKVIFDKLASGPRQRSDRKQRRLVGGGTADIYRVILMALSRLEPGMRKVDYESLRASVKDLLYQEDMPQAHEVTRVLEKMAEIASKEEMSVKVLDWDEEEQKLHITDPFFAFFLKWSRDYVDTSV